MKAGDTFRPADGTVDKFVHVWVIISEPEQDSDRVLIVSLTGWPCDSPRTKTTANGVRLSGICCPTSVPMVTKGAIIPPSGRCRWVEHCRMDA